MFRTCCSIYSHFWHRHGQVLILERRMSTPRMRMGTANNYCSSSSDPTGPACSSLRETGLLTPKAGRRTRSSSIGTVTSAATHKSGRAPAARILLLPDRGQVLRGMARSLRVEAFRWWATSGIITVSRDTPLTKSPTASPPSAANRNYKCRVQPTVTTYAAWLPVLPSSECCEGLKYASMSGAPVCTAVSATAAPYC